MIRVPTKNYRMSKQSKMLLANEIDPHRRGELKRMLIQAELAALEQPKRERDDKKSR